MTAIQIAIATCNRFPDLAADDRLFLEALQKQGATATPAIWNDDTVSWRDFDGVVIRSCWDYHQKPNDFLLWLELLERELVRVWNPVSILRGNMRKTYLQQWEQNGFAVVPTEFLPCGVTGELAEILSRRGWDSVVVKPDISASSYRTRLVARDKANDEESYFQKLLQDSGVLVQPFLPEVAELGEWSFIFIDGSFSHAALKRPRAGDFRVQDDFGGSQTRMVPPAPLLRAATRIAEEIPSPWLYARIDGVELNGIFTLIELELIEPSLFLMLERNSAARLASATLCKLAR